jgi:hypothetical protein
MSSMLLAAAAAAAAVGTPAPAITAQQALAAEKAATSVIPPRNTVDCPQGSDQEIVVCARKEVDPATQYVPSDIDNGVPDDDIPRAPDVSGLPNCATALVCAQHVGKMPAHPLIIDVKALPEPPAGSDADKMARGELATP